MEGLCNTGSCTEQQRRVVMDAYHAGLYKHGTPEQDLIWKLMNTTRHAGQKFACSPARRRI